MAKHPLHNIDLVRSVGSEPSTWDFILRSESLKEGRATSEQLI